MPHMQSQCNYNDTVLSFIESQKEVELEAYWTLMK